MRSGDLSHSCFHAWWTESCFYLTSRKPFERELSICTYLQNHGWSPLRPGPSERLRGLTGFKESTRQKLKAILKVQSQIKQLQSSASVPVRKAIFRLPQSPKFTLGGLKTSACAIREVPWHTFLASLTEVTTLGATCASFEASLMAIWVTEGAGRLLPVPAPKRCFKHS